MDIQGLLNKVKGGALDLTATEILDLQGSAAVVEPGSGGGLMDKIKGMFGS